MDNYIPEALSFGFFGSTPGRGPWTERVQPGTQSKDWTNDQRGNDTKIKTNSQRKSNLRPYSGRHIEIKFRFFRRRLLVENASDKRSRTYGRFPVEKPSGFADFDEFNLLVSKDMPNPLPPSPTFVCAYPIVVYNCTTPIPRAATIAAPLQHTAPVGRVRTTQWNKVITNICQCPSPSNVTFGSASIYTAGLCAAS